MAMSSAPLGIIGSSGGGALAAAAECLRQAGQPRRWIVVTDRPCGLADWASSHAEATCLIPYEDCRSFSRRSASYFKKHGVERFLLFYTRRIGEELFGSLEASNIHPSLLPAFPGLRAVSRAMAARTGTIGATLHRVDAGLDTGPMLLQVCNPISIDAPLSLAERISYMQKVCLTLFWQRQGDGSKSHTLQPEVDAAFDRCRTSLGLDAPVQVPAS